VATDEGGLMLPVGWLAVAAPGARPTGVARVHDRDRNAGQGCLVLEERTQLAERPAGHASSLWPAEPSPFADALEIFQGQAATGVFAGRDERLGDNMVLVAAESGLATGEALQLLSASFRVDALKSLTQAVMPLADLLDGRATVLPSVRVHGEIRYAEINTEEVCDLHGRPGRQVDAGIEEEFPSAVDEITLALDAVEARALVFAEHEWHELTPLQSQQAHAGHALERHQVLVIGHGAVQLEDRAARLVAPEDLDRLADGAHGHLGGQAEPFAQVAIAAVVDGRLGVDLGLETDPGGMRGRRVEVLHGGQEQAALSSIREETQLQGQLHGGKDRTDCVPCQPAGSALPPRPEGRGIRAGTVL